MRKRIYLLIHLFSDFPETRFSRKSLQTWSMLAVVEHACSNFRRPEATIFAMLEWESGPEEGEVVHRARMVRIDGDGFQVQLLCLLRSTLVSYAQVAGSKSGYGLKVRLWAHVQTLLRSALVPCPTPLIMSWMGSREDLHFQMAQVKTPKSGPNDLPSSPVHRLRAQRQVMGASSNPPPIRPMLTLVVTCARNLTLSP